jgi:hypothetical protein
MPDTLEAVSTDQELYPHQEGEVTDEILAQHYADSPHLYHKALEPHLKRYLAEHAISEVNPQEELPQERTFEEVMRLLQGDSDETLSSDDALLLIDKGYTSLLDLKSDRFENLGSDVAKSLIDSGDPNSIFPFWPLLKKGKFEGQDMVMIGTWLLDKDHVRGVIMNIDRFSGLNQNKVVQAAVESGYGGVLEDNFSNFRDLKLGTAQMLVESGDIWLVGKNLACFQDLNSEIGFQFIYQGLYSELFGAIDKFHFEDIEKLTDAFVAMGDPNKIVERIDRFTETDRYKIAHHLIAVEATYTVIQYLEAFPDLDQNGIIDQAIRQGYELTITYYRAKFDKIDDDTIAKKFIDSELISELVQSLSVFKELDGSILITLLDSGFMYGSDIVNYLDRFRNIDEQTMSRIHEETELPWLEEYPSESLNHKVKDRWYGTMSYAEMDGPFNKASLGHVIRLRIEHGVDKDLHDASYWLKDFDVDQPSYDTAAILRDRKRDDFDPSEYACQLLSSDFDEGLFLRKILDASPELRNRLNLSAKEGVAQQLFVSQTCQLLYETLTSLDETNQPFYKSEGFSRRALQERAEAMVGDFASSSFSKEGRSVVQHSSTLRDDVVRTLNYVSEEEYAYGSPFHIPYKDQGSATSIGEVHNNLKIMGARRTIYARDTQNWLIRHATSPRSRLTRVWPDRARALMNGVADNARDIEVWQKENALRELIGAYENEGGLAMYYSLEPDEVMGEVARPNREELMRCLAAESTLEALSNLKDWRQDRMWEEKVLPPDVMKVSLDDVKVTKSKPYKLEILDKDDVRGFTIGEDTGCCMTLHGESNSCIQAGYEREDAGFLAMYAPDGKLAAQSFWYVHPRYKDTLVLDNIEANAGRDLEKVATVYRKALAEYLKTHADLGITKVHVGTGYTDISMGDMPVVKSVPSFRDIYSDADDQRLLLDTASL